MEMKDKLLLFLFYLNLNTSQSINWFGITDLTPAESAYDNLSCSGVLHNKY